MKVIDISCVTGKMVNTPLVNISELLMRNDITTEEKVRKLLRNNSLRYINKVKEGK